MKRCLGHSIHAQLYTWQCIPAWLLVRGSLTLYTEGSTEAGSSTVLMITGIYKILENFVQKIFSFKGNN